MRDVAETAPSEEYRQSPIEAGVKVSAAKSKKSGTGTGARVEVTNLHKSFLHGGRHIDVLRGITFRLEPGEMVAIMGASGAGKSTLLHVLGTLDLPTSGSLKYNGEEITEMTSAQLALFRNRAIGFVFQFHHLLPEFTALENVMMPCLIRRRSREEAEHRAYEFLKRVGLGHRLTHKPGELSGGEQQRVALARALVMEPPLVLADEPTGNLDTHTGGEIHDLFIEMNEEVGSTLLVVTHNPELAARMPRTLHMQDGGMMEEGAPGAASDAAVTTPVVTGDTAPLSAANLRASRDAETVDALGGKKDSRDASTVDFLGGADAGQDADAVNALGEKVDAVFRDGGGGAVPEEVPEDDTESIDPDERTLVGLGPEPEPQPDASSGARYDDTDLDTEPRTAPAKGSPDSAGKGEDGE